MITTGPQESTIIIIIIITIIIIIIIIIIILLLLLNQQTGRKESIVLSNLKSTPYRYNHHQYVLPKGRSFTASAGT